MATPALSWGHSHPGLASWRDSMVFKFPSPQGNEAVLPARDFFAGPRRVIFSTRPAQRGAISYWFPSEEYL